MYIILYISYLHVELVSNVTVVGTWVVGLVLCRTPVVVFERGRRRTDVTRGKGSSVEW